MSKIFNVSILHSSTSGYVSIAFIRDGDSEWYRIFDTDEISPASVTRLMRILNTLPCEVRVGTASILVTWDIE